MRRALITTAAVFGVTLAGAGVSLAASGGNSGTSTVANTAATAPATTVKGCVTGTNRTLEKVFTNPANFPGCKSPSFEADFGGQGPAGAKGATGAQGATGPAGKDAQALPYGIGQVLVDRGTGATAWATYSTTLGSPVGDTESGTFRFTCKTVPAGCNLSVQAYTTASGYKVYPRVLIYKTDATGATPVTSTCEYADGSDNNGAQTAVGSSATSVPLAIGGTLDCGSTVQATPANGVVSSINVPGAAGEGMHYDVFTTLTFAKA